MGFLPLSFPSVIVLWVCSLALMSVTDAACPFTTNPATVVITDDHVRGTSGRAQVKMIGLVVDVSAINATLTVDASAGLVAVPKSSGDEATGLAGSESPQGFFLRYEPRLHGMVRFATVVLLTGSTSTHYNFSISWTLDAVSDYDIARDEEVALYFDARLFGEPAATGCNDPVYAGTVRILSTHEEDVFKAFATITTFVCLILMWRHPGKAIDAQTLVALSFTSCAEPHARAFTGVERLLAPFALSSDLGGMLAGNVIAIVAVWLIGAALTIFIGKKHNASTAEEAGSHVYFPRVPFLFMMAIYQGTTFCSVRLVAHGIVSGDGAKAAFGIIASLVFIIVVPALTYVYCLKGVLGEFHAYKLENVNRVWRVFAPSGQWLPKTVRQTSGGVVGYLRREERIFALLIFFSPIASAIILAFEPPPSGCMAQYTAFLALQMILVMINTWFSPWRTTPDNVLSALSHMTLSCAGAIYGSSSEQQLTIYGLPVPLSILFALCWIRLICDGLATLMDHSGLDFDRRLFYWHDGTRGGLDNVYEVVDTTKSEFPDPLFPEDDDAEAMPSPLAAFPSMTKPAMQRDETLHNLLKTPMHAAKSPPEKSSNSAAADPFGDDPFADDDDPFADNTPASKLSKKASSLRKQPSQGSAGAFDSDDDPFADKPTTPAAEAKPVEKETKKAPRMQSIAKKLLLAAKFKKGVEEKVEQRQQKEMFGDVGDDDMLRGQPLEKTKTMGDVNDMLEQMMGGEGGGAEEATSRANPMAAVGAASAFSDNQAKKTEGGKKIGGGDLAANFQRAAAKEEKVDADSVAVYRVEFSTTKKKMTLVEQDEKEFGSFFDGDSYVVVNTRVLRPNGPKTVFRELFIWVGQVSTPDEIRAAVSEAVELDCTFPSNYHKAESTGGHKITRVLQNAETTSFTSLFPGQTIKVIEGGVDAEGGTQGRLYHVHGEGARKMSLTLVPPTVDSLDDGDVFVFDCGMDVFIFQGSECSPFEREHGRQYGEKLRASRAQCIVAVVTQDSAPERFWKGLGSTRKVGQGLTLRRLESFLPSNINRLWVVKGPNDFKMEASGDDVTVAALKSNCVMIVDMCSVVYVWIGSKVSPYAEGRGGALQRGVEYLKKHSDVKIPLIRVLEGHEGETFKDLVPEEDVDL